MTSNEHAGNETIAGQRITRSVTNETAIIHGDNVAIVEPASLDSKLPR